MATKLPQLTKKVNERGPLHAVIKQWYKTQDGGYVLQDAQYPKVMVHAGENTAQYQGLVVRLEVKDKQKEDISIELSIDALMTVIYTAYEPRLIQKFGGFFSGIKIRIFSYFISRAKNK